MDNKHCFAFLFIVFTLLIHLAIFAQDPSSKPFTVVIDPGHGGQDPGAMYKNIREKDIVLQIGLKLGNYIRQNMPDTKVIFTRNKDIFIPLHQRAEIANNSKADLFISIHANFCGYPSISGTETFVLGLHRSEENLEVAKKENSVILMEEDYSARYEGFDPNSPESYIMFEMVQDEYLDQSISMAACVQDQFKSVALRRDRGVKQAGFLVLRRTSMPGILIETGFISNLTEAQYLNSEKGQSYLASAIYRAFKKYKSAVETKSDFKLIAQKNIQENVDSAIDETKLTQKTKPEKPIDKDIYFSVQLAAVSSKIAPSPSNFKGLHNIYIREQNGMYKYMYGKEQSYDEIKRKRKEAQKKFPQAFIVAFENGNQISVKNVLDNQKP